MNIVVIGSGIAGVSFAEEMRKLDPEVEITLLTLESRGYYSRPLLSHGFTRDDIETKIVLRTFAALEAAGIRVFSPAQVTALDREQRVIHYCLEGVEGSLGYDTLVLAQGSDAFIPPPFRELRHRFHTLNSLDDLIRLRRLRGEVRDRLGAMHWAVIGGGLIGCEVAADLAKAGDRVSLFHALPRLMERQLVEEDSHSLLGVMEKDFGVRVLLNRAVQGFGEDGNGLRVNLDDSEEPGFQAIIVACGFKPRTELAAAANLPTARGILVDAYLKTADPDVYAIGDVAECRDGKLYAYVTPVRSQALWLAHYLAGQTLEPWEVPIFKPKAKVPGFTAAHPYLF